MKRNKKIIHMWSGNTYDSDKLLRDLLQYKNTEIIVGLLEEYDIFGRDIDNILDIDPLIFANQVKNNNNKVKFLTAMLEKEMHVLQNNRIITLSKILYPENIEIVHDNRYISLLYYYAQIFDRFSERPESTKISKSFVVLNRRPWQHRCLFIDLLQKHNLIDTDRTLITWLASEENCLIEQGIPYDFKYWTPRPIIDDPPEMTPGDASVPVHYHDCFTEIVCESNLDALFLTEKTCKPIVGKKPFVLFAKPGSHEYLKELGYKLYDDIFDYSFDSIQDDEERAEAIIQQFKVINNYSNEQLEKMYESIIDIIEYNYNHYFKTVVESINDMRNNFVDLPRFYLNRFLIIEDKLQGKIK